MLLSVPKTWQLSRAKITILAILVAFVLFGATPGYLAGGKWAWMKPATVPTMKQLIAIKKSGINVPGWQTDSGKIAPQADRKWYIQELSQGSQKATVLLLPQTGDRQQPQVEWTDIEGIERWDSDSYQTLNLGIESPNQQFQTRFFRAWTKARTYAVVQWYAQSIGGSPSPSQWYINDRIAQWQKRRIPWVAVSIQIPMEPLDDLNKYRNPAEAIAKAVQTGLVSDALKSNA
jgi:cyanoexosortase B-associated protein